MQWKPGEKQAARLGAFATALLLGASMAYWALHWPTPAATSAAAIDTALPAQTQSGASMSAVASLLGANSPAANATPSTSAIPASRFKLIGVVARSNGQGSAIIAVDGLLAKSFKVGATVADGLVLKNVGLRRATLSGGADGAVAFTLEIPASTGAN